MQDVYSTPEGFVRNESYRGSIRDPFLKFYPGAVGSLGVRFDRLKGHITLAYDLPSRIVEEDNFHERIVTVYTSLS